MKLKSSIVSLVLVVSLMGCSKDAEIANFMTEWDTVTMNMTRDLESGNVDAARKTFDANRASLAAHWADVKGARGFQVSKASMQKVQEGTTKNMNAISSAVFKGTLKTAGDKSASLKMQTLLKEYAAVFK